MAYIMEFDDEDTIKLDEIKTNTKTTKKSLKTVMSRGKLNRREMDEMFLGY